MSFVIHRLNRVGEVRIARQRSWQYAWSQIRCTLYSGNQEDEGSQNEAAAETIG